MRESGRGGGGGGGGGGGVKRDASKALRPDSLKIANARLSGKCLAIKTQNRSPEWTGIAKRDHRTKDAHICSVKDHV